MAYQQQQYNRGQYTPARRQQSAPANAAAKANADSLITVLTKPANQEQFRKALGDKRGVRRYASLCLPMDEALILCAVDLSGRGGYYEDLEIPTEKIGDFDSQLVYEFMEAFAVNAKLTLHLRKLSGRNSHHIAEGAFKALGRALREAVAIDPEFRNEIPSTKGTL